MAKMPVDLNKRQLIRDLLFAPKQYKLDDRFVLRDGKRHPVAVVCPGGAYQMVCSYIEGVPLAKKLNEKGYSVYIVYYRTKDKALFPAPLDDLAQAIRDVFARKETDLLDLEHYSIWGSSAGGHLTACFGREDLGYAHYGLPKPAALVLSYPVISMRKELTHMLTHDTLLGKDASPDAEALTSVDEHVTEAYPATYLWCGEADRDVSPENAKRMAAALEKAGVSHRMESFPGVGHGVGPGTGTAAQGWIDRALQFLEERCEREGKAD